MKRTALSLILICCIGLALSAAQAALFSGVYVAPSGCDGTISFASGCKLPMFR